LISRRDTARSLPWKLCAAALLVLLGVVLCGRISHPWTYNDDYNGAFWSQAARNLAHAGFLSTAGLPAPLYFGPLPIPTDALYVHHPTLLADVMVLDRALLGESEWAARSMPIFFSLLTAALLCLFVSLASSWREGAFVLALFAAAPMELHYGQMVNFEAPELFFLLAALCCFHLWRLWRTTLSSAGLLLFCALAMWTDWQGYLLVILLAGQLMMERNRKMAAALLLAALLAGIGFLTQIRLAEPGAWRELFRAFRERSGHADLSGGAFTTAQWLRTEYTYLTTLFHPDRMVPGMRRSGCRVF
jgi:4-amino-4-deoxy-L-arabinose transferase-like glycosyltransferase